MKTRRKQRPRKQRGGITFANNTKPPKNMPLPENVNDPDYLNALRNIQVPLEPSPVHAENAHFFAQVASTYNTPQKMSKNIYYHFYPEQLKTHDYTVLIDFVYYSNMPDDQKKRILNYLRFKKMSEKVPKLYGNLELPTPPTPPNPPSQNNAPAGMFRPIRPED